MDFSDIYSQSLKFGAAPVKPRKMPLTSPAESGGGAWVSFRNSEGLRYAFYLPRTTATMAAASSVFTVLSAFTSASRNLSIETFVKSSYIFA